MTFANSLLLTAGTYIHIRHQHADTNHRKMTRSAASDTCLD